MSYLARPGEVPRRLAVRLLVVLAAVSLLASAPPGIAAQEHPARSSPADTTSIEGNGDPAPRSVVALPPEDEPIWKGLLGAPEPDRLHAGLWTLHLYRRHDGLSAHHLLGLSWRGFYGATFVNSHGARTWGVGITRTMAGAERRDAGVSAGYRLGLLAGYDGQLHDLAERWPVIPAAELNVGLRFRGVGAQFSWSWLVASVGGFVPLGG